MIASRERHPAQRLSELRFDVIGGFSSGCRRARDSILALKVDRSRAETRRNLRLAGADDEWCRGASDEELNPTKCFGLLFRIAGSASRADAPELLYRVGSASAPGWQTTSATVPQMAMQLLQESPESSSSSSSSCSAWFCFRVRRVGSLVLLLNVHCERVSHSSLPGTAPGLLRHQKVGCIANCFHCKDAIKWVPRTIACVDVQRGLTLEL